MREALAGIQTPVLAVWGEFDQVAPEAKSTEIAGAMRRGSTAMIPDAAHLPPAERPGTVVGALLTFSAETRVA